MPRRPRTWETSSAPTSAGRKARACWPYTSSEPTATMPSAPPATCCCATSTNCRKRWAASSVPAAERVDDHRRQRRLFLIAAVVGALCFVVLAALVHARAGGGLDGKVLTWFEVHRRGPLTAIAVAFDKLGRWWVLGIAVALLTVLLWWSGRMVQAVYLGITIATSLTLNLILKIAFQRQPPGAEPVVEGIPVRVSQRPHDDRHSRRERSGCDRLAHEMAVARTRPRGGLFALSMATSRVYLGRALAFGCGRRPRSRVRRRPRCAPAHAVADTRRSRRGADARRPGGRQAGAGLDEHRRLCPHHPGTRARSEHRRRLPRLGQHAHGGQRHARRPYEGLEVRGGGARRARSVVPPARPLPAGRRDQRRRLTRGPRPARTRARRSGRPHRRRRLLGRRRRPQATLRLLPGRAPPGRHRRQTARCLASCDGRRRHHQRHRRRTARRPTHHLVQPHQAAIPAGSHASRTRRSASSPTCRTPSTGWPA